MCSFIDIFVTLADESEKAIARRIAKTLEANGIDSMERLMSADPYDIQIIKGIGDRALNIIGKIRTKEEYRIKQMTDVYNKHKGTVRPITLRDWFVQAGCSYLEACNMEKIIVKNGCKTVDAFMEMDMAEIGSWKGIGAKRLQTCVETKAIISSVKKKRK